MQASSGAASTWAMASATTAGWSVINVASAWTATK
jgi:hypothetical protein